MIDKQILFRIFDESKLKYSRKLKKRLVFEKSIKYLGYQEVLVFSGVRRCGKTSLMYALMQYLDEFDSLYSKVYINFEDERLAFIECSDLDKLLEYYLEYSGADGRIYFFLDEIQNVPLWEKWLARSYENFKFIISGSNSNLLSSDFATALTGRHKEVIVNPFRFSELVNTFNSNSIEDVAFVKRKYGEFLVKGGFPESILNDKSDLLQDYYKNILLKDVVGRYNIKYRSLIEKLSLFILGNCGKPISLYSLNKQYDAGINTIKNYLSYLESSYLIKSLDFFSYSIKKQQNNPPRYYSVDVALSDSVAFKFSDDLGRRLENIVFLDLVANGDEIFYHRDKKECDFLIKQGNDIVLAIQVCYEVTSDNEKREFSGLLEAMVKFNLVEGLILTNDEEKTVIVDGKTIRLVPVWKWLLR